MTEERAGKGFEEMLKEAFPLIQWEVGSLGESNEVNLGVVRGTFHVEGHKLVIFTPLLSFSVAQVGQEIGSAILGWRPGCEVEL